VQAHNHICGNSSTLENMHAVLGNLEYSIETLRSTKLFGEFSGRIKEEEVQPQTSKKHKQDTHKIRR
jgi:hypothetical protein